jgi:hypothetical protein
VLVTEDRSAALLLRVWLEDGADGFRARLTEVRDGEPTPGGSSRTYAVAASPREALRSVSEWLDEFLREGPTGD